MISLRKRTGPAIVLELFLVAAMISVAYSQVFLPLTGEGGLWSMTGRYPPSVEVSLAYPAVLTDPRTNPFRFPELIGVIEPGNGAEFLLPTRTQVSVWSPDLRQRIGLVGTQTLRGLIAVAVLALLLLMVRTLRSGDPFVPRNAHRIYAIAALVGVGGTLADLLGQWGRHAILESPRVAPYVVPESYHLSLLPLGIGAAIAVAAEVFRQGTSLRAEVDGLV